MRNNFFLKVFKQICLGIFALLTFQHNAFALEKDSTAKEEKIPKHYLPSCIYVSNYSTPERKLKDSRLESYKFTESSLGFYVPLFTKDFEKDEGKRITNLHMLLVGNSTLSTPSFGALSKQHNLTKSSLGLRFFYNDGKKSVWFFNASPFVVHDNLENISSGWRYASVLLYNRTVNKNFSYRLGFVKTFNFGNRFVLPVLGLRLGPLDGGYVNIQLPKSISINFPLGKNLSGSIYVKPHGGLFNFLNRDTIYPGNDEVLYFAKYELLNGIRLDYNYKTLNVYLSVGITKKNYIALASNSFKQNRRGIVRPFYDEVIPAATFINAGISYKFGRVKKIYNNYNLYDIIDLNNSYDPGDNNEVVGNADIPKPSKDKEVSFKEIQYRDIEDLIELEDIY